MSEPAVTGFPVDEEPLRQAVLKAYHEKPGGPGTAKGVLDAVRQFLSGPPGGKSVLARYWFEEDPPASIASFIVDLERASPQLARSVLDPLLAAVAKMDAKSGRGLARNLPVYVSSLAGAVAVKNQIDETVAAAAVSAAILGLSRLGRGPFEAVLAREK